MKVQPPRHGETVHLSFATPEWGRWSARRTCSGGLLDFAQARPPVVRGDGGYWTRIPCTPLTPTGLGCSSTISSNQQPPCMTWSCTPWRLHLSDHKRSPQLALLSLPSRHHAILSAVDWQVHAENEVNSHGLCNTVRRACVWYPDSKQRQIDIPAAYQHD